MTDRIWRGRQAVLLARRPVAYAVVALLALATAARAPSSRTATDMRGRLGHRLFTLLSQSAAALGRRLCPRHRLRAKLTPLACCRWCCCSWLVRVERWAPLAMFTVGRRAAVRPLLDPSPRGIWYVFDYHLQRPLQVESVLATPLMVGRALHISSGHWVYSHGSHAIAAPGATCWPRSVAAHAGGSGSSRTP